LFVEGEKSHRSKRWAYDYLYPRTYILMPESIPEHKDILGSKIAVEDTAVVPDGRRRLEVAIVKKLSPKMVTVEVIGRNGRRSEKLLYPKDILVVDDPKVTMYMIKNQPK